MPDGTGTPIFFSSPPSPCPSLYPSPVFSFLPFQHRSLCEALWTLHNVSLDRLFSLSSADMCLTDPLFPTVTISESDIGSSASNYRGPMSAYNANPSYPRRFNGSYAAPSTIMTQPYYTSYAPSGATYSSGYSSGAYQTTGSTSERTYFSLNGKLVRSYKVRSYRVRL